MCSTPDFSYYKEFDILAMCGICDMFRSVSLPRPTPRSFLALALAEVGVDEQAGVATARYVLQCACKLVRVPRSCASCYSVLAGVKDCTCAVGVAERL